MPRRFPARRRLLRALRFFHARGRQPIEEFRDSSLFTLEIKNGIQFGTIYIFEHEAQDLGFVSFSFGLEFELERSTRGRTGVVRIVARIQYSREHLATINSLTQPYFD